MRVSSGTRSRGLASCAHEQRIRDPKSRVRKSSMSGSVRAGWGDLAGLRGRDGGRYPSSAARTTPGTGDPDEYGTRGDRWRHARSPQPDAGVRRRAVDERQRDGRAVCASWGARNARHHRDRTRAWLGGHHLTVSTPASTFRRALRGFHIRVSSSGRSTRKSSWQVSQTRQAGASSRSRPPGGWCSGHALG
jgi:hypothetical protein